MKEHSGKPEHRPQPAKPADAPAPEVAKADVTKARGAWEEEWVNKLAGDGDRLTRTVMLGGYVGRSPEAGMLRVYFDHHLHHAVDVALEGVVHREAIPRTLSPLGGSYLWVTPDSWDARKHYQRVQDQGEADSAAE
jgi:hypothetical protein